MPRFPAGDTALSLSFILFLRSLEVKHRLLWPGPIGVSTAILRILRSKFAISKAPSAGLVGFLRRVIQQFDNSSLQGPSNGTLVLLSVSEVIK